jgi:hypothetical protein
MNRKLVTPALLLMFTILSVAAVPAQTQEGPCTPGISFMKLLESVNLSYVGARLNIGTLYALCLPKPAKQSGSPYQYDPDGGGRLTTAIKTADGKVLGTFVWYARDVTGLWEMSSYKVLGGAESLKPLTAGNYLLEFAVEEKPFCRFPFSVVEGKNDDPYQPAGTRYFIEGAWNEYGNIFYQRNDPQSALKFTTWLQQKSGHESKTLVPYDVKLVRLKDGRVIGQDTSALGLQPRWLKADFLFQLAGGEKGSYLKAADLLGEDGRYAFRLTVDGQPYGEYPFVVKGGRIQFQGKQIRENTDPRDYIVDTLSGGRYNSWWVKRNSTFK